MTQGNTVLKKKILDGYTYPLGASIVKIDGVSGCNFAIYSSHASKVELCLFSALGKEMRFSMRSHQLHIWHIWISDISQGMRYGFRVDGETIPEKGRYFNPHKLLLDPYTRAVDGNVLVRTPEEHKRFIFNDSSDNAAFAPKSVVMNDKFDWQDDDSKRPNHSWPETIIYEMHVKGFSKLNSNIPELLRGTYAGLAHPASIAYLKDLGVTTVELLPVASHADEPHLQQKGLCNYWGYNVLAPFALEEKYALAKTHEGAINEFKEMVRVLHKAGIEVILDVVFNHSAELDIQQPMISMRGIDNETYYWLTEQGHYYNWTGCGNSLNVSNQTVEDLVIECLRYWAEEFHIDGFRFDLASILGRTPKFSNQANIFKRIEKEPILKDKKFIAEPWDIGEDGYQLGNFPDYFAEWNDQFRNDVRSFWLYKNNSFGLFAQRFSGSDMIFHKNKHSYSSINFISAHDGFTLKDLVSYRDKHNEINGEGNRDGDNHNCSHNFGVEGETDNKEIQFNRSLHQRALLANLLLAKGTPMLLAGDEFGHSQQGNNNAYCQDNEITWLNWENRNHELLKYVQQLTSLRKQIQALSQSYDWFSDENIQWFNEQGRPMQVSQWEANDSAGIQIIIDQKWLIAVNRSQSEQVFNLPEGNWCHIDHSLPKIDGNDLHLRFTGIYVMTKDVTQ